MNAIQFIKEHGVEKARKVVEGAPERATHLLNDEYVRVSDPRWILDGYVSIADLKRLVESVDFINKFGGIGLAKAYDKEMGSHGFDPFFEKSIADYESIYCVADMGDDTHIENHVSPLCKVEVK